MPTLEELKICLQRRVMPVVTLLNIIYGLVEVTGYKIDPMLMLKPLSRKITTVIGGIFATAYLTNVLYRIYRARVMDGWKQTWNDKTSLERMCVGIAGSCVITGWGAWLAGANSRPTRFWMIWLMVGYILGTTGHSFNMLGNFIKNRRQMKM